MQAHLPAKPQRGQVLVIMALAFTALLGLLGVAVDLGFGYAHRREAQNAADAGALAGAAALGRHYVYTSSAGSASALGLTPITDAVIWQEIATAAAASVPPFPSPDTRPPWPADAGSRLSAYYLIVDGAGAVTQGAAVGGGMVPANAIGVRVEGRLDYPTFFAQVLGPCCERLDVYASARALLKPLVGSDAGPPFIVCGGDVNSNGAWIVASPIPSHVGQGKRILVGTPARVDPTYVGDTIRVQDEQLAKSDGECSAGNSFKGNADPSNPCQPIGADPLPCVQPWVSGDRAGPVRNRIDGLPGCAPGTAHNCVVILPISDGKTASGLRVVTLAPFFVTEVDSNSHDGRLLAAAMSVGQAGEGTIDPNQPGAFTYKLVPDE